MELDELTAEGYVTHFDESKKPSDETFKFNPKMRKYNFKNEPLYPECMAQKEWNTNDIQDKVLNWKKLIMNNEDLHWFHDSSSEPLDPTNPRIQVTFDQLIGRKGFERRKVIFSTFKNQFLNEYIRISYGIICIDESICQQNEIFKNAGCDLRI